MKTTVTPSVVCQKKCREVKVLSKDNYSNLTVNYDHLIPPRPDLGEVKLNFKDIEDKNVIKIQSPNSTTSKKIRNKKKSKDPVIQNNKIDKYVVRSNKEVKNEVNDDKIDVQADIPPNRSSFKDISSFFDRTARQSLVTTSSSEISSVQSGSTTVQPILSMGSRRIRNSNSKPKNKIERGLQSQRPISVFLKNGSKDIALSTPGKRKFNDIQSIFDPKKYKGDMYDCTLDQPYTGKPVPGDKVKNYCAGAS